MNEINVHIGWPIVLSELDVTVVRFRPNAAESLRLYFGHKFGLRLLLSEITLLFDLTLDLDRTLARQKAQ